MEKLKIGKKILDLPIIQGGMGVGVSLGGLAGAVAKEGGVGTISSVGIGYKEPNYYNNTLEANKRALKKEIDKAKEISGGKGLVAVNIMEAITEFEELTKYAAIAGADAIVVGAGLPLRLPKLVEGIDVLIAPIVSSARALKLIIRSWTRRFNRLPDFVVVEGPKAAGHLGYTVEEIESTNLKDILKEVLDYIKEEKLNFPIIGAGGITDSKDVKELLELGASGVQLGTRFIATEECDASQKFKDHIVNSTEADIRIVKSPVGMPGRAVYTKFLDKIKEVRVPSKRCVNCLVPCNPATTQFCIHDALINAVEGNLDEGLVFGGESIGSISKIDSVKNVLKNLTKEL